MNKLDYGNFDITNADIAFSSTNGYSDPASEIETRKQLSYPLKELKTYINNTVSVDHNGNAVQLEVSENDTLGYRTTVGGELTPLSGGIPTGGTAGQTIIKNSSDDFDISWGSNCELLWTNPSPSSSFAPQTVPLDLTNYKLVCIAFRSTSTGSSYVVVNGIKDYACASTMMVSNKINTRTFTATDSGVEFSAGGIYSTYGSDREENNARLVPRFIYGIR